MVKYRVSSLSKTNEWYHFEHLTEAVRFCVQNKGYVLVDIGKGEVLAFHDCNGYYSVRKPD
jgi:hypothetical protein